MVEFWRELVWKYVIQGRLPFWNLCIWKWGQSSQRAILMKMLPSGNKFYGPTRRKSSFSTIIVFLMFTGNLAKASCLRTPYQLLSMAGVVWCFGDILLPLDQEDLSRSQASWKKRIMFKSCVKNWRILPDCCHLDHVGASCKIITLNNRLIWLRNGLRTTISIFWSGHPRAWTSIPFKISGGLWNWG